MTALRIWLLALFVVASTACGDSEETETTGEGTEGTSGGENPGGTAGGPITPGGDSGWDGDPEGNQPSAGGGGGSTEEGATSPWESPIGETGTPLPPRQPMSGSAQSSYAEGVRAAQAGNNAAAQAAYEQALSADSNAYKAAFNLGVLADRSGNDARALEYYRRALSIQADYERAADGIVTIYIRRGDTATALSFIEPLARQWERNLFLQSIYADTLVHADRFDAAVTAARAALRRDERFVPAMVAIVHASLEQGRTELATDVIERAMAIDSNNAQLHYLRGRMLQAEDGRLRESLESFRSAVTLRPDFVEARMALGIQMLVGANYPEALEHFRISAALAPGSVEVQLNLGNAYRALEQWAQAKTTFEQALSMRSELPEAHYNMGLMYMAAGENFPGLDKLQSLQQAIAQFTRYRDQMGPRLDRNDDSEQYLEDLNRQLTREQTRIERDRARAARAAGGEG